MIRDRHNISTVNIDIHPLMVETSGIDPKTGAAIRMRKDAKDGMSFLTQQDGAEEPMMYTKTRFGALVDSYGNILNTVSRDSYNLIKNAEVIAALDLKSDDFGLDLVSKFSTYYKGRSMWRLTTPDCFYVPGDQSPHYPMVDVWHDSRGTGGLSVRGGIYRLWCTNGATHQVVAAASNTTNHRKRTDLMEFFQETLDTLTISMEKMQIIHQTAGSTPIDLRTDNVVHRAVTGVFRNTAPRYRPRLSRTIRQYSENVGATVHALIQSISEVATHHMRDGVARHTWADQSTSAVIDALLQEVAV